MSIDENWSQTVAMLGIPDTKATRLAFQAGAHHAIFEFINRLDDFDELDEVRLRLNREINAFGQAALSS